MNSISKSVEIIKDLKRANFYPIEEHGIDGDFVESQAFGYLAIRSFLNLPITFSTTTGCKEFTVGGKLVENY